MLCALDYNNQRVRRLDHDGLVRTIMGTGFEASVEDGSPALETSLHHAFSLCYGAAGNLYLAGNHVPPGLDLPGYSGDGGPALDAELDSPCGLAVHSSGYPIYFADTFNHAVRRIDSDQTVTTIAGDGGPATEAQLNHPSAILFGPGGNLWVADAFNSKIRRVVLSSP